MQKLLLSLLLVSIATSTVANPEDCAKPTEYIMQFLKKSGTLWSGSLDWKEKLSILGYNDQIHTVYARTHLQEYLGLAARYLKLNETGVKSSFAIANKEDHIEIDSTIEDHEVKTIEDDTEFEYVKFFAKKHPNGYVQAQQDFCTKCDYRRLLLLDEKNRRLHMIIFAQCKSKIPKEYFEQELRK